MSAPERLAVRWSKKERDFTIESPRGPDGHLIHGLFSGYWKEGSFFEELERRGYDTTTLRFKVLLRPDTRDRDRRKHIEGLFVDHRDGIGAEVGDVE